MHDIISTISTAQVLDPQTVQASAVNSGDIDTQGAEALAVAVLVGDLVDTLDASNRLDLKIEHAEDDGTGQPDAYEACADADVLNFAGLESGVFLSIDDADLQETRHIVGYRGGRRFVRVTATPVSLASGGPVAMLALKGNLGQLPADNG